MESKTKALGHPVHPMLIVFPLGLFSTSMIFDTIHVMTKKKEFATASFWTLTAGVVGGLAAAPFGLLDWLAIPDNTRAKNIGLIHGVGNALITGVFGLSWLLRRGKPEQPPAAAIGLSLLGASAATYTAWLGGELVYRLRVGVDNGANLNASSSLEDTPLPGALADESDRDVVYLQDGPTIVSSEVQ